MTLTVAHISPIMSVIAGLLILIMPRLLNLVVAVFLILNGLIGLGLLKMAPHVASTRASRLARNLPNVVYGAHLLPSSRNICSHGQSRREIEENRSEIKVIRTGSGQGRAAGDRPQGFEEEPGQTGAEVRQQGGGKQARGGCGEVRQMGVYVRRRQGRGQSGPARFARRQGRQPCRDGQSRPAGASGLHHSNVGMHLLLCARQILSEGIEGAGRKGARPCRQAHRQGVRRRAQSAAGFGALRWPRLDAGHDGYRAQSRPQRHDGRGAGRNVRRSPLCL